MFNEVTPKKSLHECFDGLTEYEKGYIMNLRDSFIIDQKLDPSKREYSQKVIVSYSSECVNVNKILDYLATYFDIFGYKVNYYKILDDNSDSRDIMTITIHKTVRSKDVSIMDSSPIDIIKLEEESKNRYDHIIMTAEEARTIAYKKHKEDRKILYDYLLRIGEAIGKAAREGKYSTTFNIEGNVENDIVDEIIDTLKPLGFDITWDTSWNSQNGYYRELSINFNK